MDKSDKKDFFSLGSPERTDVDSPVPRTTVTNYPMRKERKRTETMNLAFASLREHIPNVPTDTKLSKIKTLRLAISYIRYLMEVLDEEDESMAIKRERNIAMSIANQYDTKEKRKKEFEHECLPKRKRGRTGWPQKVWALELQND